MQARAQAALAAIETIKGSYWPASLLSKSSRCAADVANSALDTIAREIRHHLAGWNDSRKAQRRQDATQSPPVMRHHQMWQRYHAARLDALCGDVERMVQP